MEPDQKIKSEQRCVHIIIDTPNRVEISAPSNGDSAGAVGVPPAPDAQPALTKRQQRAKRKREAEIEWRESQIEECMRAAGLAKEMTLGLQVRSHTALAELHRRAIDVLKAGYNLIEMQGYLRAQVVERDAEEYKDPMPHGVITALQKAIDTGLFDDFRVWTLMRDPILVGRIKKMKWDYPFEIARWD